MTPPLDTNSEAGPARRYARELLERPPHSADQPIISRRMYAQIASQAAYQLAVMAVLVGWGDELFGVASGRGLHLQAGAEAERGAGDPMPLACLLVFCVPCPTAELENEGGRLCRNQRA